MVRKTEKTAGFHSDTSIIPVNHISALIAWLMQVSSYLELALEIGWPIAIAAFLAVALVVVAAASVL